MRLAAALAAADPGRGRVVWEGVKEIVVGEGEREEGRKGGREEGRKGGREEGRKESELR